LDINRLQAGQTVATLQTVAPQMLIKSAIHDVTPTAAGRHQTIEAKVSEKTPNVWVDAEMIRRVLINLLENASKFSKTETKIQIGARRDGEFVQFWVQDNGPGIPPSEHKRIFEKFARIKGKERTSGLGIGLAFCRMAVAAHGGTIWVESEEGKGAKFLFTLPAVDSKG
jgi:K+-sensing histidine kinase KdpD